MHRADRIEQMREPDPLSFGGEPEQHAVAVEAPRPSLLDDFESGQVVAIQEFVGTFPAGVLLVSSIAFDPNHRTLTTVTSASGTMPRSWRAE